MYRHFGDLYRATLKSVKSTLNQTSKYKKKALLDIQKAVSKPFEKPVIIIIMKCQQQHRRAFRMHFGTQQTIK